MVNEAVNKAFSKHWYDISMNVSEVAKLIPDVVKITIYVCQQRVKDVKFKDIAKELNLTIPTVHEHSCKCFKYGYKV